MPDNDPCSMTVTFHRGRLARCLPASRLRPIGRLGLWARDRKGLGWLFRLCRWVWPEGPWFVGYPITINGVTRTMVEYDPATYVATVDRAWDVK